MSRGPGAEECEGGQQKDPGREGGASHGGPFCDLKNMNWLAAELTSSKPSLVLAGESKEKLNESFMKEITAAANEYSEKKLLIPISLTQRLDGFFNKVQAARTDLSFALWGMIPPGEERAKLWTSAQTIAYKEIPPLLEVIEREARVVIHGSEV